jgi:hypothetical protein
VEVLMRFDQYSARDLQNLLAVVRTVDPGMDMATISTMIETELSGRKRDLPISSPSPAARRRPDNLTTCPVCGSPAVIVPLYRGDWSVDATHAIQCQNRPAIDRPWRDGMCGHTEYIVRGER